MTYQIGDLTRTVRTKITLCEEPHSHGEVEGTCWLWTGAVDHSGYSSVKIKGTVTVGHRYVYEHFFGPITDDLTVDHLCEGHRNCVNPAHFELVTRSINSTRANDRRWRKPYRTSDTAPTEHRNQPGEINMTNHQVP